jgi:curved DNA-binding protein
MKNYYDILGVKSTAEPDEIKRAYRKLASQHHPDKGGDVAKFQEIEQAYRTLSDPAQRQQYDNPNPFGGFGAQGDGFQPFNFDTIFDIFGARFGQQQQRPRHARMSLWVTLRDIAQGGPRTITVGTQSGTQAVEIQIPQGIEDGDTVQYPGLAPGGIDLVVTFRIHPDPKWLRQGLSLNTEHVIPAWTLLLGGEAVIRDILGKEISITIPPNTQPGTVMRLRAKGLQHRNGAIGDLMVRLQARWPENISPAVLDTIRQNWTQ